jgi:hypothetical protein
MLGVLLTGLARDVWLFVDILKLVWGAARSFRGTRP